MRKSSAVRRVDELRGNLLVALSAGVSKLGLMGWALGRDGTDNLVVIVAAGTHRRRFALLPPRTVNRFVVARQADRQPDKILGDVLLAIVTLATGFGNVLPVCWALRVLGAANSVVSMAGAAGGRNPLITQARQLVRALGIRVLRFLVAGASINRFVGLKMGSIVIVPRLRVAIHAIQVGMHPGG